MNRQVAETEVSESEDGKYFYPINSWVALKIGRDIHESKEAAEKAAEEMRAKEIKSLEKQIAKIKAAMG